MPDDTATITLTARDGPFDAYRAMPATTPAPAAVLIAPIFGVTQAMRDIADRYAAHGIIALVPDPFWRVHPGPLAQSDRPAAMARGQAVKQDDVVHDMERCIASLRVMPECNGAVAVVGFCFGGKYAFLAAARGMADAAAAFHGTRIGTVLDEAPNVGVPVSFHFGDDDPVVPMEEVHAIEHALDGKTGVEIALYPGVGHGFTQPDAHGYDAAATAASEARVLALLSQLRPVTAS